MATLAVGESAPDFEALTDQNTLTKLSDYRGQRVVLYFYPKDDTSGWVGERRKPMICVTATQKLKQTMHLS